jgi:DNA-binding beta-propeller fold protein YncE
MVITPDGRFVWVLNIGLEGDGPAVFDTTTQKRVDPPIDLAGSADGLAFMADGLTAYVTDRSSRDVHVIAVRS